MISNGLKPRGLADFIINCNRKYLDQREEKQESMISRQFFSYKKKNICAITTKDIPE